MNKKLALARHKIESAKKLGALQTGKKIELAESALDDAMIFLNELDHRLNTVEGLVGVGDGN